MWRVKFFRNEIWSLEGLVSPLEFQGLIVWSLYERLS